MGIEHVGLGADFVDPITPTDQRLRLDEVPQSDMAQLVKSRFALDGFTGPENLPSLVTALRGRGYDGQRLEAIMSGNWLRILQEALPAQPSSHGAHHPACDQHEH
jgi:microsomal dipeptidase-like Zn-dependent dipeptidase